MYIIYIYIYIYTYSMYLWLIYSTYEHCGWLQVICESFLVGKRGHYWTHRADLIFISRNKGYM